MAGKKKTCYVLYLNCAFNTGKYATAHKQLYSCRSKHISRSPYEKGFHIFPLPKPGPHAICPQMQISPKTTHTANSIHINGQTKAHSTEPVFRANPPEKHSFEHAQNNQVSTQRAELGFPRLPSLKSTRPSSWAYRYTPSGTLPALLVTRARHGARFLHVRPTRRALPRYQVRGSQAFEVPAGQTGEPDTARLSPLPRDHVSRAHTSSVQGRLVARCPCCVRVSGVAWGKARTEEPPLFPPAP